ncbi:HAMP domain-containing sensor histidine kinase [Flavimaricola marinus]|uniref:histidine kinase n=1 Tax=Flavimaricola marinus TaxID=1819565 RepID=A0A238LET0_9RHOB|nr:HAMP domain-containing sensor histidine kinase [Flavimaricola marinus]SMY08118.1 Sensor kinase CusS [Flavimaricola marinus]
MRLWRSTPVRLTATLLIVFGLSTGVGTTVTYLIARDEADTALRERVSQEFESYRRIRGQRDLVERILGEIGSVAAADLIIDYRSDSGDRFSNVAGLPSLGGLSIVAERQLPEGQTPLAESYLVVEGRVGLGNLTLARNREQVSELWSTFSVLLVVSLLPTFAIASAIGVWSARRASVRVESIGQTLRDLTEGDLEARVTDVTGGPDDLAEIAAAVNQMADAQAATMASLRQVSTDIAHDLKTPIQRVSVLLEQLEDGQLTEAQRGIVDKARAETAQIVRTFQALLQIAQIEGAGPQAAFAPVDLADVVAGIVDVYEPAAEESGHRLSFAAAAPAMVRAERSMVGQVVANLIENALRHTPPGTAIAVGVDGASLSVADGGPGIPEPERAKVLRRHYRLEQSRTSEGSGLGLSLVAAIAALHDATLQLSDNAPGLRVTLTFPTP